MSLFEQIKTVLKRIPLVYYIYKWFKNKIKIIKIMKIIYNQKNILSHYPKKTPLKVVFVLTHLSVFKTRTVFEKMLRDSAFEPLIIIAPYIIENKKKMFSDMDEMYSYFSKFNYPVIHAYNYKNSSWIDIQKDVKPDMIIMSNPHKLTMDSYYSDLYENFICYYVPYSHQMSKTPNYIDQYNQLFHNVMYRIFAPQSSELLIFKKYSVRKSKNILVTGYPATEILMDRNYKAKNFWKKQNKIKKKIIFAPHHTIDTPNLPYANFLKYADYFKKLVKIHEDTIQWAFKPHPLLKGKLKKHKEWGEDKTNEYWDFWENGSNTQLEEKGYEDLFLTSDAMIHDSGSFLIEYLYVNKPVMYLTSSSLIIDHFNPFGCEAFDICLHGENFNDIDLFIDSVIQNRDIMKEKREQFLEKNITPYYKDKVPSDRIIESIKKDFGIIN